MTDRPLTADDAALAREEQRMRAATNPAAGRYCAGPRCAECTPNEPCCEATCGPCPRADCFLRPGSEDDSRYCDEHGEGWLYDLPPEEEARREILRRA